MSLGRQPSTDLARRAGNRAALAVVAFGALFVISSEVGAIRDASPWADDPYDLVLSVATLVIPVVALVTFLRIQRWAGADVMSPAATRLALRGMGVTLALVWASVVSCVLASAIAGRTAAPFVIGPVLVAAVAMVATRALVRAAHALANVPDAEAGEQPDSLDDLVTFLAAPHLADRRAPGSIVRATRSLATALERLLASPWSPRRWRTRFALLTAAVFGVTASVWHTLTEGPGGPMGGIAIALTYAVAGGAIVLLAYATLGRYLRLIGEES